MLPASLAAWVPEFKWATATSAWASAGASFGAVAGHCHQATLGLVLADQGQLGFRCGFGKKVIHAKPSAANRSGSEAVVAGDHHGLDAHTAQFGETFP